MSTTPREKATLWLQSNIDESTKSEIQALLDDEDEEPLVEAFYKDLDFGTGGLRGIMGVGSNRMNKYTVGAATQGLSNYLNRTFPSDSISVVIAYDSRNRSQEFAQITADVFSANDIKVYTFPDLRPTPQLSYAIRHLGCKSGVVITASHNPKEYNGYKAYWTDGAQVTPPHDQNIIEEVNRISGVDEIRFEAKEELIHALDTTIDQEYLEEVRAQALNPDVAQAQSDLSIVFSGLHGTGATMVPPALEALGFQNVHLVEEQTEPDGNFPTVVYPNPEESEAMTLALKKANEVDADLVMATDPDADRVGIAVRNLDGKFQLVNGNQTASLLTWYLLSQWKQSGKLTGREYIVKTIVTSDLLDRIALGFGVDCYNTLTGFKFIATLIRELEGKKTFIGGGEESYGFMIGDFVRDKDAVSACAMLAEMTAFAKQEGHTLFEKLIEIYQEYGFYLERLISVTKPGKEGAERIVQMMADLRQSPPSVINNSEVVAVLDYETGKQLDPRSGETTDLDFPKSNVLQFITADGSKISARPSGTEPKIKFYFSVNDNLESKDAFAKVEQGLNKRIDLIISDLKLND